MPPRPIKVAFLITDLHLGGSPRMLRDLALGLAQHAPPSTKDSTRSTKDFMPSVISLKSLPPDAPDSIPATLRAVGIPVHAMGLSSMRQFPFAVPHLARVLNQLAPDVIYSILVHANALATVAYPLLRRTSAGRRPFFIQSIHTLQDRPAWHWTLQGKIARFADAMIAPSQPILDRVARFGTVKSGTVIPNGIDIDRFANAAPMPDDAVSTANGGLRRAGRGPVVGYVGRFDRVKNLPVLLQAFAQLPATPHAPELVLVGYGPEENALRGLATSLHIAPRVHFPGPTTTPERWYKLFDIMCLPSTVEGFGLTLIEAMAAGVPLIAPRTAVTAGIVREGIDGQLLSTPLTSSSLATCLQVFMQQWGGRKPLPTSPHQDTLSYLRSSFSTAHMVELHRDFLQKIPTLLE